LNADAITTARVSERATAQMTETHLEKLLTVTRNALLSKFGPMGDLLFASLKRHTRRPLNFRQHRRKNSAKIKIRVPIKKVPTQESDDASGKRPTKGKVLVVHRIGSSALTA